MAFDFPNSPSVGQRVTGVGGIVYVWDGVKWTNSVGGVTVQSMGDVGRNLINNPLFNVAQRGAGPWSATGYTADRWAIYFVNGTLAASILTLVDADRTAIGDEAATYCLSATVTGSATAGSLAEIYHHVEGTRRLAGKTVTLSFWAWAGSGTPKLGVALDQNWGTGGSPSAQTTGIGQSVTLSITKTRYSLTFSIPSAVGKTIGTDGNDSTVLNFWLSGSSDQNTHNGSVGVQSAAFQLWGVQLEIGSVATPLEKRDPVMELQQCQRFYQVIAGASQIAPNSNPGAVFGQTITFPPMRAAPTIGFVGTTYGNASGITAQVGGPNNVLIYATATAGSGAQWTSTITASADL